MLRIGFIVFSLLLVCNPCRGGITFDGTDDYIDTNYTPSYSATDDLSVCGWFDLDDVASVEEYITGFITSSVSRGIIQIGLTTSCASGANLNARFRDDDGNLDGNVCGDTAITVDTPHSFCLTYDDSAADSFLYLDGVETASDLTMTAVGSKNVTNPREWFIGARDSEGTPQTFWDGDIYEVAYWDNAFLSAAEVLLYHNSEMRRMPCQLQSSTLLKYFPMDDVADGVSADAASFRNECGSDEDVGTGVDGGNNTGLTGVAEKTLSYP